MDGQPSTTRCLPSSTLVPHLGELPLQSRAAWGDGSNLSKVLRYRHVVRTFPPGWATNLAILEHCGSIVDDREDHLVIRTPHNPTFTGATGCSSRTKTLWRTQLADSGSIAATGGAGTRLKVSG